MQPGGTPLRSRSLWDFELQLPPEPTIDDAVHHHRVVGPANHQPVPVAETCRSSRHALEVERLESLWHRHCGLRAAVGEFAADLMPLLAIIGGLLIAAAWLQVSVGLRPLATVRNQLAAIRSGESHRLGFEFPSKLAPWLRKSMSFSMLRASRGAVPRPTRAARSRSWPQDTATGHSCKNTNRATSRRRCTAHLRPIFRVRPKNRCNAMSNGSLPGCDLLIL